MEIFNVLKELKSRLVPSTKENIKEFARRRYDLTEEDVNEKLILLTRDGKLLMTENKKIQY